MASDIIFKSEDEAILWKEAYMASMAADNSLYAAKDADLFLLALRARTPDDVEIGYSFDEDTATPEWAIDLLKRSKDGKN